MRVILLQTSDLQLVLLQGANACRAGVRCPERGHDWDLLRKGCISNYDLIFAGDFAAWSIDNEMDVPVFHSIKNVRTPFADLINIRGGNSCCLQGGSCARSRNDAKTEFDKLARDSNNR